MINSNRFLKDFMRGIVEFTGAKYCVLTNSCSNAIFLSLKYKQIIGEIEEGSVVEIPSQTYLSVPAQIKLSGLQPKLVYKKWVGQYEIGNTGVIDSARQFYKDMHVEGEFTCCSFHSQKILSTGGGCILLDDKKAFEYISRLAWDGRDVFTDLSEDIDNIIGYHMNMIPEVAAQGIIRLSKLPHLHPDNLNCGSKDYYDMRDYKAFKEFV